MYVFVGLLLLSLVLGAAAGLRVAKIVRKHQREVVEQQNKVKQRRK